MDIQKTIEDLISKFTSDKGLAEQFKKDPVETVKSLVGSALSTEELSTIVSAVKAKIGASSLKDKLGSLFGK